ncbi:MAG: circadian clock protein KaiC [Actinomycetota bacterium]
MRKACTGVQGLDLLMGGGYPAGRTTLILGGPGTGKTLLAMQGLAQSAAQGEGGIFVSFEEAPEDMLHNFGSFAWDLETQVQSGRLTAVDARLQAGVGLSGSFELDGLLGIVAARLKATGAQRLVLDGLDILLSLEPNPHERALKLLNITRFVRDHKLTALVTVKSDDIGTGPAIAPYLGDCVISLDRRLDGDITVSTLEVVKYRGAATPGLRIPITIDDTGISLLFEGKRVMEHKVFHDRISSGVKRLDTMLGGGYYRGTTVLLSGAPGTAKTTLASATVDCVCKSGEKALFVSFDESSDQVVRNLKSVGIDLESHAKAGLLEMISLRAARASAQLHVHYLCQAVDRFGPSILVIDPVSALMKSGNKSTIDMVVELLVDFIKMRGITGILTSLVDSEVPEREVTLTHISTIADSWLHLTFVAQGGERNRALTVVKSRGSAHSNQVRELVLTADGPKLTDVYTAGGQVLMGTARLERQSEAAAAQARSAYDIHSRRSAEVSAIEEAKARIAALEAELEARGKALALLNDMETKVSAIGDKRREAVLASRSADSELGVGLREDDDHA